MPNRFFDEVVTKDIRFNLASVERVNLNKNDEQSIESDTSQTLVIKPMNTVLPTIRKELYARPLLRGLSDSITRGDLVLYTMLKDKTFYFGPLNTKNNPNFSPNHYHHKELDSRGKGSSRTKNSVGYGKNYPAIAISKIEKQRNNILDDLGPEYETSKHSDMLLEGRHGNAIRIGSRSISPVLNISNNNISSTESLIQGSLISMMSVGSILQHFGTPNSSVPFLLSTDNNIEGRENYKLNLGNVGLENTFDYNYGEIIDNDEDQIEFDQILICSDRITFDARAENKGDFTISANSNINFGARKNFTLNNAGYSVINSHNIYLGLEAQNKTEPLVMGDELRKFLLEMMTIILDSRALVHGVKIPLVDKDTTTPIINRVQRMIDELQPRTYEVDEEGVEDLTKPLITNTRNDITRFFSQHHYTEKNRQTVTT